MSRVDAAVGYFQGPFNCAQAVFSAFAPELGLDRELAQRTASGFGGGMGRMGEVCGAVTGAFMVLGLRYGHADADPNRERTYRVVQEFAQRFKAQNGSILCRELLGTDIGAPEGRQAAREAGLFSTLCPRLVRDAAEVLEQLLQES